MSQGAGSNTSHPLFHLLEIEVLLRLRLTRTARRYSHCKSLYRPALLLYVLSCTALVYAELSR